MWHKIRCLLLSTAAFAMVAVGLPDVTQADDYWNEYWRWYDSSYRPYYERRYRIHLPGTSYRPYFRGYRYYGDASHSYYRPHGYYGGYHTLYGPHSSLQIGPLHLDWR